MPLVARRKQAPNAPLLMHGQYIKDYCATLQRGLPSELHIDYTEDGYQVLKKVMDRRYDEWTTPTKRRSWPF